jgi:hypothetical protein
MAKHFSDAINEIMPLVKDGDKSTPFIIYRKTDDTNAPWFVAYPYPAETANDALKQYRENDPCAVMFTGADFSDGSFPYVFDKVLLSRLYAENISFAITNNDIPEFFDELEDNIGELSTEAAEYLTTLDNPLEWIDSIRVPTLMQLIEEKAAEATTPEIETAPDNRKRVIEGYEEKFSIKLGGRVILLAENPTDADPYLICNIKWDNPFSVEEPYAASVTDNYLEAVHEFVKREAMLLDFLEAERSLSGLPFQKLTAADCVPNGLNDNIEGKVIVIKADVLSPEYQSAEYQLKICHGGNGSRPEARGRAVFCENLFDGKQSRFERYDVLGVADLDRLPDWAKTKLAEQQKTNEPPQMGKEAVKTFTQLHKECASAIDETLNAVRTPGKTAGTATYDLNTALNNLNSKFGDECVSVVLAAIVAKNDYDGRYSNANKVWANGFDTVEIEDTQHSIRYCTVNTHPTVLDGLVSKVREKTPVIKPNLHDRIEVGKKKAAAKKAESRDKPATKKKNQQEVT